MIYESSLVTRFCESDYMGHISNISYFIYLETVRVDFLCDLNISQVDESWDFVVASIKCDFVKQMYPRQRIKSATRVLRIGNKSITLGHKLLSEEGETLATAEEVIVRFNKSTQSTQSLDESMIEKLRRYEKNEQFI
ncbi:MULTISPECIES: thioesterase family protein [unclassified Paenibacillus]|uniref:acyl-CoA thioesterase n=1 Tax=unclassified Paenibacillus TaxID=185978 RepID=UPI001AEB3ECA|nr:MULTISPECIES: thioesterase family protein [unclassified Paenibacillus]MBP1155360.1 acyl-CoA thioester hydrolase [Paenibacillus sp. PvP091]MBP1169256.1 acyl-CoA thioester hydrolase [Paenibacillus sp. PvR098]MBP2440283.1 acyl-CoA thioester hydrolase [Paenibacillus sp. PvP052]